MMEDAQDNTPLLQPAAEDVQADAAPVSVGRQLREARERQGLSVDDVVSRIKLAPRQVHALEADDFGALPEMTFVRGFVRSYARALQLDVQPLLDALPGGKTPSEAGIEPAKVEVPFPVETSQQTQNMRLLVGALALALLISAFAAWQAYAPQPEPKGESATAEQAQPVESAAVALPDQVEIVPASGVTASEVPAASAVEEVAPVAATAGQPAAVAKPVPEVKPTVEAPPADKPGKVRLVFDKDSWTEVKDKSGRTLAKRLYKAGQEVNLDGEAPFSLLVGHASAVHLYYRGKPVDMTPNISASSEVARLTLE